MQSKLEYLQKKYAKLGNGNDRQIYEQRRRPRVVNNYSNEDEKYLEGVPNRSMMKTFD